MRPYQFETKTYFAGGTTVSPNCMKIMPLEPKKKLQKFAIGDSQTLQYWESKKGEMTQAFKSEAIGKEISRVVISGNGAKFSVFFAAGQSIRGVTKKGKEFFKLDTSHTEVIRSLHVQAQSLWSAGEYILNCYESVNNKIMDKYFYICEDRINDMVVASVSGQMVLNPVLACQDKSLKVMVEGQVLYQQQFDSACTALALVQEQSHRFCPIVGFGLKNGGIGCIELTRDEPVMMWSLEGSQTNGSEVAVIKTSNLTDSGPHDFILARDDGTIEIYSYEHNIPIPTLRFETKIQESITGIDIGHVSSPAKQEILISCYNGTIMSLVDSKTYKDHGASEEAAGNQAVVKKEKQQKVAGLQKEVELLKKKAAEAQDPILEDELDLKPASSAPFDYGESFKVSYKMNIIASEAAYSLFIDSQLPIDCLVLQSKQNVDIISVKDNQCSINKMTENLHNNVLVATLKVKGEEHSNSRVEIKIRTSEGQMGNLQVFVLPKTSTNNKTCQVIDIPLKPLNLHERVNQIDQDLLVKLPLSKIKVTGEFSLSDGHNWVSNTLPDFPPNASQEDEEQVHIFQYRSTFIGTYLLLQLSKEQIVIQSDNLSVITIIKDQVTQDASMKKITLDIESDIYDESVIHSIDLLHPLVLEQYEIAKKHQLIDGLQELTMHEEDTNFLSNEYKEILRDAEVIKQAFQQQPRKLAYLWGIIADLYIDTAKIKGHHNVQSKMGTLKGILNHYNYEDLLSFFKSSL